MLPALLVDAHYKVHCCLTAGHGLVFAAAVIFALRRVMVSSPPNHQQPCTCMWQLQPGCPTMQSLCKLAVLVMWCCTGRCIVHGFFGRGWANQHKRAVDTTPHLQHTAVLYQSTDKKGLLHCILHCTAHATHCSWQPSWQAAAVRVAGLSPGILHHPSLQHTPTTAAYCLLSKESYICAPSILTASPSLTAARVRGASHLRVTASDLTTLHLVRALQRCPMLTTTTNLGP